jgi:hypothetical protein
VHVCLSEDTVTSYAVMVDIAFLQGRNGERRAKQSALEGGTICALLMRLIAGAFLLGRLDVSAGAGFALVARHDSCG